MAFTSIIHFDVKPGQAAIFERAFAGAGMLTRPAGVNGFIGAELVRSVDEPTVYYVVGKWESPDAYARWQAIAFDEADPEVMKTFYAALNHPRPGRLFKTVITS